ncbi:uncharacterized protein [Argopecten irradians]|uniref:uncharacterized protein n=1 Tax=Argopecten irradians TaxID=31199 RepID=UPI003722E89B
MYVNSLTFFYLIYPAILSTVYFVFLSTYTLCIIICHCYHSLGYGFQYNVLTGIFCLTGNHIQTGKQLHRHYTTPDELKKAKEEWSDFLNRSPERFNIKLPELPDSKDQRFLGYSVRYLRPEITKSWRYTLKQEPTLDQYGQRPMPANVFARYRDTYPQYSRNISSEAWR